MDYLVEHAIDHVWCTPRQDRQYILRPKRISRPGGEIVQIEIDWGKVYLPDTLTYYHVYQIGDLHPDFLGLFPVKNQWVSLATVANKMGMIADAYTDKGILLPKFETYYFVTDSLNLVVATRKRERQLGIDYNNEDIFLRVYTNAYYQSPRSNALTERTLTNGRIITTNNDILLLQQELVNQRAKPVGYAWGIVNGRYVEEISPFTCKPGDLVDWVYDSSVQKAIEFEIDYLPNFDSTLDSERKYLMHYAGPLGRIEYQDDIDLFIVDRTGTKANGLYHHKNSEAALRMVTHKDYSMSVRLINAFVDGHPTWTDPQKLRILMLVRESGYDRPLTFENNRIHELYKLKDADIIPAMVGDNASVPNWNAAVLENAAYTEIMRMKTYETITRSKVQEAYGYNAISKLIGESTLKVVVKNGARVVEVPRAYRENSTAYEYNASGRLVGWYFHQAGSLYLVNHPTATVVEIVQSQVNQMLDELYNQQTQQINPKYSYRMYIRNKIGGVGVGKWKDVSDSSMFHIAGTTLTWLVNMSEYVTLVRSDKLNMGYPVSVKSKDGLIDFMLTKYQWNDGAFNIGLMDVPMGELELIMNGCSLIEHVDYVVHFPRVIIFNKKYLVNPETQEQQIAVRWVGHCRKDLSREVLVDQGFVKWELLSRNAAFNVRDDRVLRIVMDGRVYHRDTIRFSEDDSVITLPGAENGLPYSIRDMFVPLGSVVTGDSYTMRDASRVIDKAVGDYLTTKLPEIDPGVPNVIPELYPVFSPFVCKILYDLINGVIDINLLKGHYEDDLVRTICAPYEWILDFDPTQTATAVDPTYVIIHPHHHNNVMNIDIYHYKFLQRVVNVYMKDKVVLSHFLRLASI